MEAFWGGSGVDLIVLGIRIRLLDFCGNRLDGVRGYCRSSHGDRLAGERVVRQLGDGSVGLSAGD